MPDELIHGRRGQLLAMNYSWSFNWDQAQISRLFNPSTTSFYPQISASLRTTVPKLVLRTSISCHYLQAHSCIYPRTTSSSSSVYNWTQAPWTLGKKIFPLNLLFIGFSSNKLNLPSSHLESISSFPFLVVRLFAPYSLQNFLANVILIYHRFSYHPYSLHLHCK